MTKFVWKHALSFVLALLIVAGPARADVYPGELTLVVERRTGSIELYLGGQAEQVVTGLGASIPELLNDQGFVPFPRFNQGTWTLADDLLANVAVQVGAEHPDVHSMSLMVHPADLEVPFRDSFEAVQAVSICAVAEPPADLQLHQAQLYAGYIGYVEDSAAPLNLLFSVPAGIEVQGSGMAVIVYDYTESALTSSYETQWVPGQPLLLDADKGNHLVHLGPPSALDDRSLLLAMVCAAFGLTGLATLALFRRKDLQQADA